MTAPSNHNGGPPLAERNFKKRWAVSLFNHPDKKPMGSIAMAFLIYTRMDGQGCGATISDAEFMFHCGVSDGSVRVFKRWLIENEFIRISIRGRRGSRSEFQATIPAASAAIVDDTDSDIPAVVAGNTERDYRQSSPVKRSGIPANAAGKPEMAAANAGIPSGSRARDLDIITNTNNPLEDTHTPLPPQPASGKPRVGVTASGPRDGEEEIGHGVFVNCNTVRHRHFTISIEAIAMQLATASGLGLTVDEARQYARNGAMSHALDWAAQIENGKLSGDVVPKHIANFIRGSVASQLTKTGTRLSTSKPAEGPGGRLRRVMEGEL
jgi:hypothetical protein